MVSVRAIWYFAAPLLAASAFERAGLRAIPAVPAMIDAEEADAAHPSIPANRIDATALEAARRRRPIP